MQFDGAIEAAGIFFQRQQREGIGREIRFRHRRAAAIDRAALFLGAVGIVMPALPRRHHVAMRVERDHRAFAGAEPLADHQIDDRAHAVQVDQRFRHPVAVDDETELLQQLRRLFGVRAQSPGGLSDGTRTSAFRKSTSRAKF